MIHFWVEFSLVKDPDNYMRVNVLRPFITIASKPSNNKKFKSMRLYYYPTVRTTEHIYIGPMFTRVKAFIHYATIMSTLLQ